MRDKQLNRYLQKYNGFVITAITSFDQKKSRTLNEVLEVSVPSKYYLSRKAVEGMIKRSKKWGRGGYVFLQEMGKNATQRVKHLSLQQLERMTTIEQAQEQKETISQKQYKQNAKIDSTQMKTLSPALTLTTQLSPTQSEQPSEVTLPLYGKTLILRKLMPIEKERLMGFPEGWTDIDEMSDAKRGHGLGNSIVPQVAEEIFKRIKELNNTKHRKIIN